MFKSAESRYALRCSLFGIAGAVGSLQQALPGISGDEAVEAGLLGIGAALAYAGIGAASGAVEPFIGNKMEPPPEPPAGDA
jgi:hypothetical protein